MSLKNINDDLYNPESHIEARGHEKSTFDPEISQIKDVGEAFKEREWPEPKRRGLTDFQKKVVSYSFIGAGIVFVSSIAIFGIYRIVKSSYEKQKMFIEIKGPEVMNSSQEAEYTISYQNRNWLKYSNVEIVLDHSDNFQLESGSAIQRINSNSSKTSIGKLGAGKKGEIKFKGKFFAPQDYVVYLRAKANYTPWLFSRSRFEENFQFPVLIKKSPIKLDIDSPVKAASGQVVEYTLEYENQSEEDFSGIEVKVDYPDGFEFYRSVPKTDESNNIFKADRLLKGEKRKIFIEGTLSGKANDSKTIIVTIGSRNDQGQIVEYLKRSMVTQVTGSPLTVSHRLKNARDDSNTVNLKDSIYYNIKFKNIGTLSLRNVIVTVDFNTEILDFNTIKLSSGHLSVKDKRITWKAVDLPNLSNLEPGVEGEINFELKVKEDIEIKESDYRNFTIESIVKIDSPDVPTPIDVNKVISSDTLVLKLNSPVIFENKILYNDDDIQNFGPLPPKIGEETSYAIHWKITNKTNDVSGVKIESSLPSGIKWKNLISPADGNIFFNERTHQMVWEVGKMSSGEGVLSPAREIKFQVSIIPESYDYKKRPTVLNKAILSGSDMFTGQKIKIESGEKTINLVDDPGVDMKFFNVEQ